MKQIRETMKKKISPSPDLNQEPFGLGYQRIIHSTLLLSPLRIYLQPNALPVELEGVDVEKRIKKSFKKLIISIPLAVYMAMI